MYSGYTKCYEYYKVEGWATINVHSRGYIVRSYWGEVGDVTCRNEMRSHSRAHVLAVL